MNKKSNKIIFAKDSTFTPEDAYLQFQFIKRISLIAQNYELATNAHYFVRELEKRKNFQTEEKTDKLKRQANGQFQSFQQDNNALNYIVQKAKFYDLNIQKLRL